MRSFRFGIPLLILLFALATPGGEPGSPGKVIKDRAGGDGALRIALSPGTVQDSDLRVGLVWTSRMPGDLILLEAWLPPEDGCEDASSLRISLAGEDFPVTPVDSFELLEKYLAGFQPADNPGAGWTVHRFWIDVPFLERIVKGKEVSIAIGGDLACLRGEMGICGKGSACRGFRKFLRKVKPQLNKKKEKPEKMRVPIECSGW